MSSVIETNKFAVQEVVNTYYQNSNPLYLSDRDLFILLLEPIIRDQSVSVLVDQILGQGIKHFSSFSEYEISEILGIKENQSFPIMALFELSRRYARQPSPNRTIIRTPEDAFRVLEDMKHLDREHFEVLYLNIKNIIIGRETISIGSLNAAIVHPREVFKSAIRRGAAAIIAAHNHPSGDSTPSQEDIDLTMRLVQAGEIVGIDVLDHVIIASNSSTSLKQHGCM